MPPVVFDLKTVDDPRDVVHQTVAALAAGKIVALPTETVYGIAASALDNAAVERLSQIKGGRGPAKPFAFAIKSYEDALDYVPDMSPLARRLARRCWPGPVTLVLPHGHHDSVISRLPEGVQQKAVSSGTVGLRVPAHDITQQILRLLAGPIVLTSANLANGKDCVDGSKIVGVLADSIDLIINDGRSRFGQSSSVVKVDHDGFRILRHGVIDEKTIKHLSGFIAVVVCTGNTCRSPMGAELLKKHLANRFGCSVDELETKNVSVISAGIGAVSGAPAAPQAVEVMKEIQIDLSDHCSQPLTERLANFADVILTMTDGHRQAIIGTWPQAAPRTHVIRTDGIDVLDPIGMTIEVYRSTAQQISEHLKHWADQCELHP